MRCNNCGMAVPDWLWVAEDHPVIVQQNPTVIRRTDHSIEDNTMKVVAETLVQIKMCKDVIPSQKPAPDMLFKNWLSLWFAMHLADIDDYSNDIVEGLKDAGFVITKES